MRENRLIKLGRELAENGISSEYDYVIPELKVFVKRDTYCWIFYEDKKYLLYYPTRLNCVSITQSADELINKIKELRGQK